ncbi:hypothetical protein HAP48_0042745 [Bradyrhizobium septentrionale]|uniref:Uncharacterized protein n=1 Tax=Bradyrhizobium septentrionale TaxID=1404411 RepID=A0A973W2N0_9BRAD|nr:hypothetical protein [Bradyrhizobium septentrionale]UGY15177.1 hypothetical protein HAP48_0042745 [Bradyrhizobium septentrionale]
MTKYTATCQVWTRNKLVTSTYAIPMESEAACYRTAGSFRSMTDTAFVIFMCDGEEFFRVACEGFYQNKKAIQAKYPDAWRDAPKGKGGPGALRRRAA